MLSLFRVRKICEFVKNVLSFEIFSLFPRIIFLQKSVTKTCGEKTN
jgi:hypothetical protein